jgi:hypothetical protein
MGFGTNRIVSKTMNKTGLSSVQMKGMSMLLGICGAKKTDEKIDHTALLKINALKNTDAPNKNKLMSDFDDNENQKNEEIENIKNKVVTNINIIKEGEVASAPKVVKKPFSLKNLI